jgi:hypothetical protein
MKLRASEAIISLVRIPTHSWALCLMFSRNFPRFLQTNTVIIYNKMTPFRDISPSSLVEVDRLFRSACCLHRRPDDVGSTYVWNLCCDSDRPNDGGRTYLWNVGRHSIKNTAVHPTRFWASTWYCFLFMFRVNYPTSRFTAIWNTAGSTHII